METNINRNESLIVKNFLVIKNASFEIKKLNIIIGPQANGKSILAKLIYFFREIINKEFLHSINKNETKQEFLQRIDILFSQYFPSYTWKDKEFLIVYNYYDLEVRISKEATKRKITIELNDVMLSLYRSLKAKYRKYKSINKESKYGDIFWEFNRKVIAENEEISKYFNVAIFITAGRSFFANLQKNIFSFLSENIDIDPFVKNFGSEYEFAKKIYNDFPILRRRRLAEDSNYEKVVRLVKKILDGEYIFKDGQDWIQKDGELINLANASSGQQESLPMLLILSTSSMLVHKNGSNIYFIEEPEAHLFPASQKHIVSIIAMMYNLNHSIVITTHSPYILSALNNLILAKDIINENNAKQIYELVDRDTMINFDDVSAYTIENGHLKSIVDNETRLVGINIIDSVSDDFSNTFDNLLAIGSDL